MDPGGVKGQTSWSAGSTRRRLAAGEAKRGGAGAGFTYRAPFGAPLGAMDSWEWLAAGGAGSWVRGRRKRRRRRVWRWPELGFARARRGRAQGAQPRAWTALWGHEEHVCAIGRVSEARERVAQRPWRRRLRSSVN